MVSATSLFPCRPAGAAETPAAGNLLQSAFWAEVKQGFGWQSLRLMIEYAGSRRLVQILYRHLGVGLSLAYIPYPDLPEPPQEPEVNLTLLARSLAPHLPRRIRFIRFDLPWYRQGAGNLPPLLPHTARLRKAPLDIQPPSTVLIDLRPAEEQLLEGMKPKTRYNIRLAERKGVVVMASGEAEAEIDENLRIWYNLYEETACRDKIVIHTYPYYRRLFRQDKHPAAVHIKLLLARVEGQYVAGIILAFCKEEATYLYGASSDLKRNWMPNHALQWEAIRQAKQAGCTRYDFFGIPEHTDPAHPMSGLYRFKTGFGGTIINRSGCYDYVLSPLYYALYRLAERLRKFYFKKWRKRR